MLPAFVAALQRLCTTSYPHAEPASAAQMRWRASILGRVSPEHALLLVCSAPALQLGVAQCRTSAKSNGTTSVGVRRAASAGFVARHATMSCQFIKCQPCLLSNRAIATPVISFKGACGAESPAHHGPIGCQLRLPAAAASCGKLSCTPAIMVTCKRHPLP